MRSTAGARWLATTATAAGRRGDDLGHRKQEDGTKPQRVSGAGWIHAIATRYVDFTWLQEVELVHHRLDDHNHYCS